MPVALRDGRPLFYREAGAGPRPVVLVHGWCCDHTYMAPQMEHLARRHRVIALDLSGHGQSDSSQKEYSLSGFADEVAWLIAHLDLVRPLVVGHSMGGSIALELAHRHPDVPAAIVALDSTIVAPPERRARMEALLPRLRGPAYPDAMREVLDGFFAPWDDPARKARIVDAMTSMPQHVLAEAWAGILAWDGAAATAACRVPALYIAASAPRSDLDRMRALCPQLMTAQVAGAGHFLQLEVPDQVNAMLDRFLAIALA